MGNAGAVEANMPDNLLNFNPNRGIGFDPDRDLLFDPDREILFDPDRDLGFNPDRDLGFGHRGVVFRGYVCAACGALTSETATRCTECGAVFEDTGRIQRGTPLSADVKTPSRAIPGPELFPARGSSEVPPSPRSPETPPRTSPTAPAGSGRRYCVFCGARVWQGDAFCWNCGNRSHGSGPASGSER